MKLLRIAIAAAVVGVVAYWPIELMPAEWYGWILLAVALVALVAVAIDNAEKLAELKKLHWLKVWEWTESRPAPLAEQSEAEQQPDVRITRPSPKEQQGILGTMADRIDAEPPKSSPPPAPPQTATGPAKPAKGENLNTTEDDC